jgi:hypothetical protein
LAPASLLSRYETNRSSYDKEEYRHQLQDQMRENESRRELRKSELERSDLPELPFLLRILAFPDMHFFYCYTLSPGLHFLPTPAQTGIPC